MAVRCFLIVALLVGAAQATSASAAISTAVSLRTARANPIRKVVTLLQRIEKKVQAEGKRDEELYEKAMCFCKKQTAELQTQIQTGESKGSDTASALEEGKASQAQLKQDLKDDQVKRAAAKQAVEEATAIREKEATAFAANKAEATANIDAMTKALQALAKGTSGSFLQTNFAQTLRQLVKNKEDLFGDNDKEEVEAFLQGGDASDAEGAGEIVGILKQLNDEMSQDLADATTAEKSAIENFGEFVRGKENEQQALQNAIEEKMTRLGDIGVANAMLHNSIGDAGESGQDTSKLLADLEKDCANKQKEFEAVKASRADELVALADTIKMINDDDALELFKKAIPSASSFMQVESTNKIRNRALNIIRDAASKHHKSTQFAFIAQALHGKKIGFDKVITLMDKMVVTLKTEQTEDDDKKEYCQIQFDQAEDSKKALERKASDFETAIDDAKEKVATLIDEIKGLQVAIKDLDKSVQEANEQRYEEKQAYNTLMSECSAAKELIGLAKNRLNKFYNPKLYKAAPKRELSEEDRIAVNMGGTAPPTPAPGGIAGTGVTVLAEVEQHVYLKVSKKSEEAGGVIAMMDLLLKDLDKELTVAETEEKNAQADFETAMTDAIVTRAADVKLLSDKTAAKAQSDGAVETYKAEHYANGKELRATMTYLSSLHADCDWLMGHYDQRKEARADEIEAIANAKAVLKGADYSLVQVKAKRGLRGGF
jgi:hypothetical protein